MISEWDNDKRIINVKQCKVPVVTLVTMAACSPCKRMEYELLALEEEYKNRVVFGKIRADQYGGECAISSVPRIFITTLGRVYGEYGTIGTDKLKEEIEAAIEEMEDAKEDAA